MLLKASKMIRISLPPCLPPKAAPTGQLRASSACDPSKIQSDFLKCHLLDLCEIRDSHCPLESHSELLLPISQRSATVDRKRKELVRWLDGSF